LNAIGRVALAFAVAGAVPTAGVHAAAATGEGQAVLGPVVSLRATEESSDAFPAPTPAVGALEPGTVLQLHVSGFESFGVVRVRQCVQAAPRRCGNALDAQLAEDGTAAFQYLVHTDFAGDAASGGCRARAAAACSIVAEDVDGDARIEVVTVFDDPLPPPARVTVTPRTGVAPGDELRVTIEDAPRGSDLTVLLCGAPATHGPARCSPISSGAVRAAGDGTVSVTATIPAGPIGTDEVLCRREQVCGISVVAPRALVQAEVVRLGFAIPPGAAYDGGRLALGLGGAALLLLAAVWLVRRTDWAAIGEEAAPEIDDAEYADLDAIVAALPPEEDDLDVLSSSHR
jgi:hypothetical protein